VLPRMTLAYTVMSGMQLKAIGPICELLPMEG
jgi:hypothetical protein